MIYGGSFVTTLDARKVGGYISIYDLFNIYILTYIKICKTKTLV